MSTLIQMFISFLQIGFTSFNGLSMISIINREMTIHGWMTTAEVADIVAIAEMTPGPLGINCATFCGLRTAGLPGAFAAMLGVLAPTLTVTVLIGIFFQKFKKTAIMQKILLGIRPACIGLSMSAVLSLSLSNYFPEGKFSLISTIIGIAFLPVLYKNKLSIPLVVLICGVLGLVIGMFVPIV